MNINKYLDIKPEVAEALAAGKPVVALESTIISHGMPYPQNVETAARAAAAVAAMTIESEEPINPAISPLAVRPRMGESI